MMPASAVSNRVFISGRCAQTISAQRLGLARYAASKGWSVELGGRVSPGGYVDRLEQEGFTFHPLPVEQRSFDPSQLLRAIAAYYRVLRKRKPAVFHGFTMKPMICGLIAAWLARVPVRIATVPGLGHVFLSASPIVRTMAVALLKLAFRCADRVFFYNTADREEYVKRGIVSPEKAFLVAGSGIDTRRFLPRPLPDSRLLQAAYVGRLLREKGVPDLFKAVRLAAAEGIQLRLHLIGDCDPDNPSALSPDDVRDAIADIPVTWHGMVADVRPLIAECHVVVLPSQGEGIPLALLEGAAMGRALIATDVPGCRDVVIEGKTGLLVPPGDIDALLAAIQRLANSPQTVSAMGQAAREDVMRRFDTEIVNAEVLSAYHALLASKAG